MRVQAIVASVRVVIVFVSCSSNVWSFAVASQGWRPACLESPLATQRVAIAICKRSSIRMATQNGGKRVHNALTCEYMKFLQSRDESARGLTHICTMSLTRH
jgi:hypothetical protein